MAQRTTKASCLGEYCGERPRSVALRSSFAARPCSTPVWYAPVLCVVAVQRVASRRRNSMQRHLAPAVFAESRRAAAKEAAPLLAAAVAAAVAGQGRTVFGHMCLWEGAGAKEVEGVAVVSGAVAVAVSAGHWPVSSEKNPSAVSRATDAGIDAGTDFGTGSGADSSRRLRRRRRRRRRPTTGWRHSRTRWRKTAVFLPPFERRRRVRATKKKRRKKSRWSLQRRWWWCWEGWRAFY